MTATSLRHDAVFYDDVDDLVRQVLPFATEGLDRGDAVVAVLPTPGLDALRDALGDHEAVEFVDACEWYRQPVQTIGRYHRSLAERIALGHPLVRIIGEVQFGTTTDESRAWTRYEAALNRAFTAQPAWIVCPYSTRTLPAEILADARRTHPHVHLGARRAVSMQYQQAGEVIASLVGALDTPGDPTVTLDQGLTAYRARRVVGDLARRVGFDDIRVTEVVLAISEMVANAHLHGGGQVGLRAWAVPGQLICAVSDTGTADVDPLAGYLPPDPNRPGGRGLWIARQLADQLELIRADGGGHTAWLRFSASSPSLMPTDGARRQA